jgi:hypothetical protein
MRDGFCNCRAIARAKVFVRSAIVFLAICIKRIPTAHLGMRVDVDGD